MKYICIDIGGTAIKYGIIYEALCFTGEGTLPTQAMQGGLHVLEEITSLVHSLQAMESVAGICISTTGIVDPENGIIMEANPALMPSYTGLHIADALTAASGLPCSIENDVNCAALAEYFHGAGKNTASSLTLTVGTGIGGAFLLNGRLLSGHSFSACEIGYMHMEGTSFEELAAASVLVRRVRMHYPESADSIDGRWIFDQAIRCKNEFCINEIQRMCNYLSQGIANLCYTLNPEVVILGGGIMHQKEYLMPLMEDGLTRELIAPIRSKTRLAFAENDNNAGMLGAYCNFRMRSSALQ